MFKTVLLPIDGSALSARAVPFALQLARSADTRLIVVRAYLPSDDSLPSRIHYPEKSRDERLEIDLNRAQAEFQSEVDSLRERACPVEPYFVEGAAADVIFETARKAQANLILMSTHGRGGFGRWLYGSVADEVIRRVPVPVLLVSPVCGSDWTHTKATRVLVPLDGSDLAAEVLQSATDLAASLGGAEMMLLAIVEPPVGVYPDAEVQVVSDPVRDQAQAMEYLETVAAKLASSAPGSVTRRVAFGDAALTIASVARETEVDAIAMATHGRGGLARLALGSVATRTLQLANMPVLVYRPVVLRETVLERAVEKAFSTPTGSTL
jgi:nucleotide-binding universal stress UspA family protein